jgi:cytochrome b561
MVLLSMTALAGWIGWWWGTQGWKKTCDSNHEMIGFVVTVAVKVSLHIGMERWSRSWHPPEAQLRGVQAGCGYLFITMLCVPFLAWLIATPSC